MPSLQTLRVESADLGGRGKWQVRRADGDLIGLILEDRSGSATSNGAVTYYVAHNEKGEPFSACWRSEGHSTIPAAVAALEEHLQEAHDAEHEGDSHGV